MRTTAAGTDDYPDGDAEHPKSIYVKEAALLPGLDAWLGSLFDDSHLDETCAALAGTSEPDPEVEKREAQLRAAIADCERKIRIYRQLLDDEDSVHPRCAMDRRDATGAQGARTTTRSTRPWRRADGQGGGGARQLAARHRRRARCRRSRRQV